MGLRYPESTVHEVEGARLRCAPVPWDTETFGFEVAQLQALEGDPAGFAAALAAYDGWCRARGVRFSSARLPLDQRQALSAVQAAGFEWIEQVVYPALDLATVDHDVGADLGLAREDEREQVAAIAGAAFVHQRFHVDPRFPRELADRRYAEWVARSWEDPADQVVVLRDAGRVAGFWVVSIEAQSAYLPLTAVAEHAQGRGLGRRLWRGGAAWAKGQGARGIRTCVSAANLAVLGLYGRLGWRFHDPAANLHRWHDA